MKRRIQLLSLAAVFCAAVASASPTSPQEMAAELERWLAAGGGALLPPGSQGEIQEGDSLIFVDASWPTVFQSHIGETVAVRISPVTGVYEFIDSAGAVFWREFPVHPLTWNWLSPFLSPFVPDRQGNGKYGDGIKPTYWRNSTEIFQRYLSSQSSVKYG